jgi:Zn-dependent protease/CBS domain-containing protein
MVSPEPNQPAPGRIPGSLGSITLFEIPVRFHFTFWLALIWLVFIGFGGKHSAAGLALYVISIFLSILLHELGHALVARRFRIRTLEIVMLPLGGLARLERQPVPAEEFWVALAGPLVNFFLGMILLGVSVWQGVPVQWQDWMKGSDVNILPRIATANLILAFFNLLPTFPMDGGRVLRSLLAGKRRVEEATRIVARIGTLLAAMIGLYGLLSANFILIFFAFFVYVGAAQESVAATGQVLLKGESVRAAMITDFRTLTHGDTIRQAAELLLATSQQDFPVLAGEKVVGLLSRTSLLKAMASEGPESYVAGAMDREYVALDPEEDLAQASQKLSGVSCALVFENGLLAGLLTSENLSEFLVLQQIGAARKRAGMREDEQD